MENIMATESVKQLAELSNRAARSMVGVIDALSTRGAYKGEELLAIGQLRDQAAQLVKIAEMVQTELAEEENKES